MNTQVSAYISKETKMLFEEFSSKSGQKKGFILEQALLHYINANKELPDDVIVPASVTVSKEVFENSVISR